jgi:rRNA maturation protein Nop10
MLTCPHCGCQTRPSNNYVSRCVNTLDCGRYVMRDDIPEYDWPTKDRLKR